MTATWHDYLMGVENEQKFQRSHFSPWNWIIAGIRSY